MPKKILVPTDCSETSLAAVEHAGKVAQATGAKLVLLHVVEPARRSRQTGAASDDSARVAAATKELEKISRPLRRKGLDVELSALAGAPGKEILLAAATTKADLIVMGTHGRSGLMHVLMGSVAEKVAREAPCPVVTLRTRSDRARGKRAQRELQTPRTRRL